jgi:hypothetical protein
MNSFNFEIVLNYTMNRFKISPPTSYSALIEIIKEKFDLVAINKLVFEDDDEDITIKQESDYLKLLDLADSNEYKEIELIIKSDEEKKAKKKKSLRKRSSLAYTNPSRAGTGNDDCLNGIIS